MLRPTVSPLDKRDLLVQVISASVYEADYFPVELGAASRLTDSFPRTPSVDFSSHVVAVGRKVIDIG
ncbi:hypothetical protein D7B24_009248 [Verticillium nonalfalfae]|uniref:Uncharacterized protein n=1 Tax=Verticillium nonalfalfae TaxID=1051616 RepID=A0A3M9YK76_9PEZI|nr:uncharacterized protein D7B24_009248 [Verticillium nonalfalfae]RNJ60216.1 hypothetical protein D7B24_009248 [Verticillium nonalfalfae]